MDFDKLKIDCLRQLLSPIIRFCLRSSITLQDLIESAKVVFVKLGTELMQEGEDNINTSRLAVMTGVHRKDVQKIRDEGGLGDNTKSFTRRLLAQWEQDRQFCGQNGKPLVLTCGGEGSDFWRLVRKLSKELNPATVLFELERINAVRRTPRGLKLTMDFELLRGNPLEGLRQVSSDATDLLEAVRENVYEGSKTPNLHLRTEYDNVFVEDLPEIREWLVLEGSKFHKKVREYLARFDQDLNPNSKKTGGGKVMVGAFSRVLSPESKNEGEED